MEKRILVIDDEKPVRDSFRMAMEDTDILVDTAASGEEGVTKFKGGDYSLVFLDLKMPGMNGIDTLRAIRNINPTTLVYIVTAFSHEYFQGLKGLKEAGIAFELLRKPLSLEQIEMVIRRDLDVANGDVQQ